MKKDEFIKKVTALIVEYTNTKNKSYEDLDDCYILTNTNAFEITLIINRL
jgi:hypothetical protein